MGNGISSQILLEGISFIIAELGSNRILEHGHPGISMSERVIRFKGFQGKNENKLWNVNNF